MKQDEKLLYIYIYMDRQFMMNKMHLKKWTWVHKVNTFKNK